MFLLSLLAALAGTPLRQAEAADDLARSLAEVGCGDVLEEADGGVGDDAGDTIKADASPAPLLLATADALPATFALAAPGPGLILPGPTDRSHAPPASSTRRHALLQRFLF
jgi:hypothetical protein